MFFRRMFSTTSSNSGSDDLHTFGSDSNNNNSGGGVMQRHQQRNDYRKLAVSSSAPPQASTPMLASSTSNQHRAATTGANAVQLTPLWEHILRTRTLPDSICPLKMFGEFLERLRDPEWQVRQHALRVLVDVLVVMRSRADAFMDPLIPQLVENLGHQAPTVRKGTLDCLRVYLAETAMPETILLQILDIGLNQKITNEPFGGRLTCGVMLSLPALVQSTLHTPKRHFILRSTIDMLVQKMGQVTHQEITLKVLTKLRELIGEREFVEFMSHGAFREYELLCNVYGVNELSLKGPQTQAGGNLPGGSWRLMSQGQQSQPHHQMNHQQAHQTSQHCWRSSDEEQMLERASQGKVILETEIKINDDTVTMRILEAKDDDDDDGDDDEDRYPSLDDEVVCGRLMSAKSLSDSGGVIRLLSDSETDERQREDEQQQHQQQQQQNQVPYFTVVTPSTPSRTPKRVTFGGEVVKMRTPDSDAASSNNNNNGNSSKNQSEVDAGGGRGGAGGDKVTDGDGQSTTTQSMQMGESITTPTQRMAIPNPPLLTLTSQSLSDEQRPTEATKTSVLTLEIPNDNTKPLPEGNNNNNNTINKTDEIISRPQNSTPPTTTISTQSPLKRENTNTSLSPKSPFRRLSVSPVDNIVSPRGPHKAIEVLHNLQSAPSPSLRTRSARRASVHTVEEQTQSVEVKETSTVKMAKPPRRKETPPPPQSWEDLGIVDYDTIMDLRSPDWRQRLQGICQLQESLRVSENVALVQPCLDSLLRTLLSSERNADVAEEKRRLVINLITRLPLDNLEDRTVQIMSGLCRQGGAGANRVCKALMQRLPPGSIVLKLISQEFLHAKSSRFREHSLQMVMYALMTFPSTCFDTATCITSATFAALNRKRRVRQAALDVLAILGQISTTRSVLDVVQQVVGTRDDGSDLRAAVKARLSRKQLPLITADGQVQYTLRVQPSPNAGMDETVTDGNGQLGPDIEWITAGVGSVSPTSLKRRAHRNRSSSRQSFCCLPSQAAASMASTAMDESAGRCYTFRSPPEMCENVKEFGNDDNHSYNMLGNSAPYNYGKKPNVDYTGYLSRKMVAKSCSDSSMDGRSSDSTYTSSNGSGGGRAAANGDGISGRFTRQAVNSRFPAMNAMDLNATYVRVHKPPTYYPGMGAYAHLQQQQYNMNSTYPKVNYTMPPQHQQHQQRRRSQPQNQQERSHCMAPENFKPLEIPSTEPAKDDSGNLDGTYTICSGIAPLNGETQPTTAIASNGCGNSNNNNNHPTASHPLKRFVNVEKFIMQSSKAANAANEQKTTLELQKEPQTPTEIANHKQQTPTSTKSNGGYSQKSTASLESSNTLTSPFAADEPEETPTTPLTTLEGEVKDDGATGAEVTSESPLRHSVEELQIEDIVDTAIEQAMGRQAEILQRNASLNSLHSKTESIKTQLGDTPTVMSRAQSAKSLAIDEEIDNQFVEHYNDSNVEQIGSQLIENFDDVVEQPIAIMSQQPQRNLSSASMKRIARRATPEVESVMTGRRLNRLNSAMTALSLKPPGNARSPSPTIAELKAMSQRKTCIVKSMENLNMFGRRNKDDSLDNTTETSSSQSSTIAAIAARCEQPASAAKPLHTPLKQKAKSSLLLKGTSRRVSPVKQAIKMVQGELYPSSMLGFQKPREALLKAFDQMDSANWEINVLGLKSLVRVIRHHPEYLETQMHMLCMQLKASVRNLRSQVSRAACQAATELFTVKSKSLEIECDDLVCALLHRTADTNRFLRADATKALESMCDNLTPVKVLNILSTKGAGHQHALVKTTTAKLLNRLVERLGYERVYALSKDNRDKFFVTGGNLLLEGSLDTRSYAKSLFRQLAEHPSYKRLVLEVIPARTYRNIKKTLKSIQG